MLYIKSCRYFLFRNQRGAALLIFFILLLLTAVLFLVGQVALDRGSVRYENNTTEALAQGKEALLAYAVSFYQQGKEGFYGFLPCPETQSSTTEGNQQPNCTGQYVNAIGRLPWKTLGIPPVKDGAGECLWYAVSGEFKFGNYNPGVPPPPSTRSEMHNADSPGMFRLYDENLNLTKGTVAEDRVVAVVIAPGPPLAGQNRPAADVSRHCKVAPADADPIHYLEAVGAIDNTDVSAAADTIDGFVTALNVRGSGINDRIITITVGDIFAAVRRQTAFTGRMHNLTEGLARCIAKYGIDNMQTGGTCDPVNVCRTGCDTDRTVCRTGCDTERTQCLLAGNPAGWCNQQRNACRNVCDATRTTCRDACASCVPGNDVYRLPWPAPVDLAVDFRVSSNYTDDGSGSMLGRFPFDVTSSNNQLIIQGATLVSSGTFLDDCTAISVNGGTVTIDFSDLNDEYRRLYEHWKDHFFYVVGEAYAPSSTDNTCGNCPGSQGAVGNPYAAMVFYSGQRTGGQLRRSDQTDPGLGTKGDISNYLEGSNSVYPDATGSNVYNINPGNDHYCLIDNDAHLNAPPEFTITCGP